MLYTKKGNGKRIDLQELQPNGYKYLLGLDRYVHSSDVSHTHLHLIYIRASQINGCSFCVSKHSLDALADGESTQRLFLTSAWRETDLFSEEERIVLAMTEEITLIHQDGLTDATYLLAVEAFGEVYVSALIMAIVMINAWNRVGVSTRLKVEKV